MIAEGAMLSVAGLKARGWTDALIRHYLGEPDELAKNPHYRTGPPMRLFARVAVNYLRHQLTGYDDELDDMAVGSLTEMLGTQEDGGSAARGRRCTPAGVLTARRQRGVSRSRTQSGMITGRWWRHGLREQREWRFPGERVLTPVDLEGRGPGPLALNVALALYEPGRVDCSRAAEQRANRQPGREVRRGMPVRAAWPELINAAGHG